MAQADDTEYLKAGPKASHSTIMTVSEEAVVIAFRRHTLLPLGQRRV